MSTYTFTFITVVCMYLAYLWGRYMTHGEIAAESYANPSELGNMHKYGEDYQKSGVCYETVMNDIKLGIAKMKEYAYG